MKKEANSKEEQLKSEINAYLKLINQELKSKHKNLLPEANKSLSKPNKFEIKKSKPILQLIDETLKRLEKDEESQFQTGFNQNKSTSLDYSKIIRDLEKEMNNRKQKNSLHNISGNSKEKNNKIEDFAFTFKPKKQFDGKERELEPKSVQKPINEAVNSEGSISDFSVTLSNVYHPGRDDQRKKSKDKIARLSKAPAKGLKELLEMESFCSHKNDKQEFDTSFNFDLSVSKINSGFNTSNSPKMVSNKKSYRISPISNVPKRSSFLKNLNSKANNIKEQKENFEKNDRSKKVDFSKNNKLKKLNLIREETFEKLRKIEQTLF